MFGLPYHVTNKLTDKKGPFQIIKQRFGVEQQASKLFLKRSYTEPALSPIKYTNFSL